MHVNVLPMDSNRVLKDYTVLVQNGKITQYGPADSIKITAGTNEIDGSGKFLIPGLADMHMHIDRKEMLPLFLAAGVTTALNMGLASPEFVTLTRYEIAHGTLPGPQVFAAFMVDGPGDPGPEYVPTSEGDARAAVDRAKLVGYDFIKVYSRLQPDIYKAVVDEAKRQHIAVVGHIPNAVGLEMALASGQVMVAHGEEYYKTFFGNKPDEALIPKAAELTRESGAYVTPNLSFFSLLTKRLAKPAFIEQQMNSHEARYVPPDIRGGCESRGATASERFVAELHLIQELTFALSKANVPLLAGTDTPALCLVPGFSLDADLEQLVIAGLTPYQALTAATRSPGEFIHNFVPAAEAFGTISVGSRADLVLLAANPLDDIKNVRNPIGVMANGRWFGAHELQAMIEKPVPAYKRERVLAEKFERTLRWQGAKTAISEFRKRPHSEEKLPESLLNSLGYQPLRKEA
jgi:imidazolonepropionase-like amidohydrolase